MLWQNVRDAFKAELRAMYITLRSGRLFNYEHVRDMFTEHQSVWPERLWNEDAFTKYLQPYLVDGRNYLDMLLGDKSSQRDWWLYNAFKYRDSKYGTGDAKANRIILRGYIDGDPNDPVDAEKIAEQIAAANIVVTPYAHIYASVVFGSYTLSYRLNRNEQHVFNNPMSYMNDTEIYIDSADQLSDVGDLSVLRLGKVADFSAATKLQRLIVGSSDANYRNTYLQNLAVGNNELLTLVNVCNCTALESTIDLSGCTGIETVLASGSSISGLTLPVGGHLKTLVLPDTVANFTIRNQKNFESVTIAGYNNITTLRVENTPNIPIEDILAGAGSLNRVRLVGVEWTASSEAVLKSCIDRLDNCIGMDVFGNNTDKAVAIGRVNISSISAALLERIQNDYPDLVVVVNGVAQYIVKFYNSDTTLLYSEVVAEGNNAVDPVSAGYISAPTREGTDTVHYVFKDWGTLPTNVHENSSVVAQYTPSYLVKYVNPDGSVLQSSFVTTGGSVQYTGSTPTQASTAQYSYTFKNWSGADDASNGKINSVTGTKTVTATYTSTTRTYTATFKNDDGTTLQTVSSVPYGTTPSYTGSVPTSKDGSDYEFEGWTPELGPITDNTTYTAKYKSPVEDVEITDDWPTIMANVANGTYVTTYKLGNYKPLDLGTEGTVNMQIVAMDEDVDKAGNTIPITWITKEFLNTMRTMNSYNITAGGYPASAMKTYLSSTIKALIPEALAEYVKPAMKTSWDANNSEDLSSLESVWIPSYREIFGGTSYENSGAMYTSIFKDSISRIKKSISGTPNAWWLRSAHNSMAFKMVGTGGLISYDNSVRSKLIILGLCSGPDTIQDTWEEISAACADGTYKTKYSIGDTKALDLGSEGVICMQIAAFDADDLADGSGKAPITWVAQQLLVTKKQMNTTGTNANGYPATNVIKPYLDNDIWAKIPSNVQAMIKTVSKTSYDKTTGADLTTSEKLWIPSAREIFGGSDYEQSGPVYSDLFIDATSRKKWRYGTSFAAPWWLRSTHTANTSNFRGVNGSGNVEYGGANNSSGVCLSFCTGARSAMDLDDTWQDVDDAIRDGSYKTKYVVGDTVALDMGTEYNGRTQIVAIDGDVDADGNTIPLTFIIYVRAVQALVSCTIDGKYGKNTRANVLAFQATAGLPQTGNVGKEDWAALWDCPFTKTTSSSTTSSSTSGTNTKQPVDYKQYDSKWKSKSYTSIGSKSQTIGSSGCGPTSMADIMATWINSKITPVEMCQYSLNHGYRTANSGTAWGFFKSIANTYGFSGFVQTKSMATAREALKNGALVAASMGPGYWTKGGHYICLWKTDDTYMYANDPASSTRKKQKLGQFEKERKQFFIFYRPR